MVIISRKEAVEQGLVHFYTGKPCKRGHDANRYSNSGACVPCMMGRVKAYNDKFRRPVLRATRAPNDSPRVYQFKMEVPIEATEEQRAEFVKWLQLQCVPAFFEPLGLRLGPPKSKG